MLSVCFFFAGRRRHTRCALVTGVQTCALPISVASAVEGQRTWAQVNPQRRARVLFEFKRLLERDMDALAWLLSSEHGKVLSDARGDLQRGLEVIEFSCGIPHLLKGEYTQGPGPGIYVYSAHPPLAAGAGNQIG